MPLARVLARKNVIAELEFEPTHYNVAVQNIN